MSGGSRQKLDANVAESCLSYIDVVEIRGVAYGNTSRNNCLCEFQKWRAKQSVGAEEWQLLCGKAEGPSR